MYSLLLLLKTIKILCQVLKFLEFKFKRNDKITTIRINYREGFHWKWSEFVDIVNQKLQEEN